MKRKRIGLLALTLVSVFGAQACSEVPGSSTPSSQSTSSSTSETIDSSSSLDSSSLSSEESSLSESTPDSSTPDSSTPDSSTPDSTSQDSSSSDSSSSESSVSSSSSSESSSSPDEPVLYNLVFNGDEGVSGRFLLNGEEVTTAQEGDTVILEISVTAGYVLVGDVTCEGAVLSQVAGNYTILVGTSNVVVTATSRALEAHAVEVVCDEGVSVETRVADSVSKTAILGDTVTLYLTFEPKYEFASITSNDVDLEVVTLGSVYSFTMPDEAVTINVETTFIPEAFQVLAIENIDETNIQYISGIQAGDEIDERFEESFTFTGNYGFDYKVELIAEDGIKTEAEIAVSYDIPNDSQTVYQATFTMPSSDVVIRLSSWAETADEGVLVNIADGEGFEVYGVASGSRYAQESVKARIVLDDGYLLKDVSYSVDGSENATSLGATENVTLPLSLATSSLNLSVTVEYTGVADITLGQNADFVVVSGNLSGVTVGSNVSLHVEGAQGYAVTSVAVTDSQEAAVAFTFADDVLSFVLPEDGVTVDFEVVGVKTLQYEEADGISDVYFSLTGINRNTRITEANVGTEVAVRFTLDSENYRLDRILLNGTSQLYQDSFGLYVFTVPGGDDDVVITFELTQRHAVAISQSEAYTIAVAPSSRAIVGDNVSFQLKENPGYRIDSVTVEGVEVHEGTDLGWYSFTMPDSSVSINVATSSVTASAISFVGAGYHSLSITDKYGDALKSGDIVNEGDEVKFSFQQDNGFILTDVTMNGTPLTALDDGSYSFIMPAVAAEISINLAEQEKHAIAVVCDDEHVSYAVSDNGNALSLDALNGYVGHEIKVTLSLLDIYTTIDSVVVSTADETVESTLTDNVLTFTMPSADVTVTVNSTYAAPSANVITIDNQSSATLYVTTNANRVPYGGPSSENLASGAEIDSGVTVYILTTSYSWNYSGTLYCTVTNDSTGEKLVDAQTLSYSYPQQYAQFVMPNASVTITVYTA